MTAKNLSDDLNNCIIDFSCRVLLTDLVNDYGCGLDQISKILEKHLSGEEKKGNKFEIQYLLHGVEKDSSNERLIVVNEEKLKESALDLLEPNSALYSVERAGGGKSPAAAFTPVKYIHIKVANLQIRDDILRSKLGDSQTSPIEKLSTFTSTVKETNGKMESSDKIFSSKTPPKNIKSTISVKKNSPLDDKKPKTKSDTDDIKAKAVCPSVRKGIGLFFSKETATENKTKPNVIKPPTPKKMDDFFQKPKKNKDFQVPIANVSKNITSNCAGHNVSKNLFEPESNSEDEDEELAELKRKVLTDDEESMAENEPSVSMKRRRIIDSDEDEPEKKIDRKNETVEVDDYEGESVIVASETFLDEDGFVITIKAPAKNTFLSEIAKKEKGQPETTQRRESAKETIKLKPSATKSKQGSITNFFSKK